MLGDRARRDVPIGPLTTYRVGGRAALFVDAGAEQALGDVRAAVGATGVDVLVIGNGSNLLVADSGFAGVAIKLGDGFGYVEAVGATDLGARGATRVAAGGATLLPVLARRTAALGLTGLEWAVGVPGSVGGALRMNAGGHGSDIRAVLARYRFVDLRGGEDGDREASDLGLAYRSSRLAAHQVVVRAEFDLAAGDRNASEAEIAEIVRWRRENQPGGQNAGSVFTNPEGDSAGRLIEAAGLKGNRLGSAEVSSKHANFIQADPGGSADDVLALIRHVQRVVEEHSGVRLQPELRLIGFAEETR
jgi:UDP-N-acetylmuramate dehydrogenase